MDRRGQILQWLSSQNVNYKLVEHPAAFDMEDIKTYGISQHGEVCKNLFLRDSKKGTRHFLVTVKGEERIDLGQLGEKLGQRLSFASENRLQKYLNLHKGEVTPLGVFFDEQHQVEVCFDSRLSGLGPIGIHPCDNTATVFLEFDALLELVKSCGNTVKLIDL